ncbi:MAG: beta-ketoacyl-ACP synthase [Microcoleus sp. PH2017_40_RAT_O_B]|uniref:beta-ketoacyl synthase N-terminal-like domain-containing protein n=1 Tax=unclassified Microcoleus TaxID=2642155 RepID=UPI001D662CC8|nr:MULTISPECIES: beta-ketoacyl synthase N-terminal-like domain-containing protein [unclassified Microcoleus]MCC3575973.1 beta-ketoacyl-ACP synthase [Microcoleus sp. PH2017_34_RAT_O_A]MCC3613737.1 beta-ketoacyl-ACP synthase [Microcoleus sp. PH2017_40_RAT_O_B]
MDVVVTGIGLVSALGNLENSWKRLLSGESGIRQHQPFLELEPQLLALVGTKPADLISLILPVLADALQDANLTLPIPDCGIAIGSSRGFQANLELLLREGERGRWGEGERGRGGEGEMGRIAQLPMPNSQFPMPNSQFPIPDAQFPIPDAQFVDFLPHMGAIAVARAIGSMGPVLAPMAACATGLQSIARAVDLIRTGECQRAIAGAVEAPITPLTVAGFNRMGALANTGCYPFDEEREGLVLGEGGALFVLESSELARRRNARIYGLISGFGLTNDAFHANSPELGGKSAIAAVNQCLKRSNLTAVDIDFIHAHGTGTDLNDRHEALLIQKLFRQGVAVSSTKGATGHTLGASGALGVAFCLMGIKYQVLPPCTGIKKPGFELDFVRCARSTFVRNAVCLSFGFGGQNAGIVLSQGDR